MKIEIELSKDVADRLKIAAEILQIGESDLIAGQLAGYAGKSTSSLPGNVLCEVFNALSLPIKAFKKHLEIIRKELEAASDSQQGLRHPEDVVSIPEKAEDDNSPSGELNIRLSEPESLMLQIACLYREQARDEYAKECLRDALRSDVEGIAGEDYFKAWMEKLSRVNAS